MSNRTWRTSPAALVNRVPEAKADLIAAFGRRDPQRVENGIRKPAERRLKEPLLESSVVEWLDKHPATSPEGRCAWCGRAETADAAVLPYGTEPGTHVWLHTECWEPCKWLWTSRVAHRQPTRSNSEKDGNHLTQHSALLREVHEEAPAKGEHHAHE